MHTDIFCILGMRESVCWQSDGLDSEFFHVNDADGNLAHMPETINIVEAVVLLSRKWGKQLNKQFWERFRKN